MNHMAGVAKLIGVELGKPFKVQGKMYVIRNDGFFSTNNFTNYGILIRMLMGELKVEWTPKDGERVWFLESDSEIHEQEFDGSEMEIKMFKNGLVKRTEAEAIAKRDELGWVCE